MSRRVAVIAAGAVAAGACVVALAACGGAKKDAGWQRHYELTNEITALWTQIRQWRSEARMDLDPPVAMLQMTRGKTVRDVARTCPANHSVPTTCNDVCSIADNICDNAERICTLADELGKADDFAQQKCTSAKASCKEAKQKCCACSEQTAKADARDPW